MTTNNPIIAHRHARPGEPLGDIDGQLYEYVTAANGVFLRARRPGLAVCFPIAYCEVRGLAHVAPLAEWWLPRVPLALVEEALTRARREALEDREILFHLLCEDGAWRLVVPQQQQSSAACRPLDDGPGSTHQRAVIEMHSHHQMPAFFSPRDDRDERTGFRLYAVLGRVLDRPEIRVRVGCHGYFWPLPARLVFETPENLRDLNDLEVSDEEINEED